MISTHVPHKRYDRLIWLKNTLAKDFNSRTSQEVRLPIFAYTCKHFYFNSRTSQEVRPTVVCDCKKVEDFNSRTSQEVRRKVWNHYTWKTISTHVPHKRYDKRVWRLMGRKIDFNSRTSQEVRRYVLLRCGVKSMNFNSRTSQEVRQQILLLILTLTTIFALN